MKKLLIITVALLPCFGCQKKLIGYIEVHGVVIDYFTKQPQNVLVSLVADDATTSKNSGEHSITLVEAKTDLNGAFSLRSKPSKSHRYYLYINGKPYFSSNGESSINVRENEDNLVDPAVLGTHTFTCDVQIIPITNACIDIYNGITSGTVHCNAGTTAQITTTLAFTAASFINNKQNYTVSYSTKSCNGSTPATYSFQTVPVTSFSSVLSTTINY
jgi:hypothetical protein